MTDTELTVEVNGTKYPVWVDGEGEFRVTLPSPGEGHGSYQVHAPSYADLVKKARKIKAKFEFPFSRIGNNHKVQHGTVTGFHASSGNLLVRWADGSTEQLPSWSSHGDVTRRLSDAEAVEIERLLVARNKAQADLNLYLRPLNLASLKKAAEQARDEASKETK